MIYFLVQIKNGIFHVYLNDFNDLLLPYFSGCKNKKINQKTNPAASKMKVIMTLAEGLFQKLNNITKNSISDDPRSTSLLSILKKKVWFIFSEQIVVVFMASYERMPRGPFKDLVCP